MTVDIRGFIQPAKEPETLHQQEIRLAVEAAVRKERDEIIKICQRAVDGYTEVHTPAAKCILEAVRNRK